MLDQKKNFIAKTFSRCVAEMCPGVVRLEYHLHDNGDEVVIIRPPGGRHWPGAPGVRGDHPGGAEPGGGLMAEIVVWQDGRPKCRYINCVPTPEEQRSLRRGGCEIRVDGKAVKTIIREESNDTT